MTVRVPVLLILLALDQPRRACGPTDRLPKSTLRATPPQLPRPLANCCRPHRGASPLSSMDCV